MSTTTLCEDDIKEVKDFLYEIRLKWYDFGIELEVKTGELDVIKSKYRDEPGSCLRETLKERLRFPDNPLTWSAIAKALNAKAINEVALATKAAEKTESKSPLCNRATAWWFCWSTLLLRRYRFPTWLASYR